MFKYIKLIAILFIAYLVYSQAKSMVTTEIEKGKEHSCCDKPLHVEKTHLSSELVDSAYVDPGLDLLFYRSKFLITVCNKLHKYLNIEDLQLLDEFKVKVNKLYLAAEVLEVKIVAANSFTNLSSCPLVSVIEPNKYYLLKRNCSNTLDCNHHYEEGDPKLFFGYRHDKCHDKCCLEYLVDIKFAVALNESGLSSNNCTFSRLFLCNKVQATGKISIYSQKSLGTSKRSTSNDLEKIQQLLTHGKVVEDEVIECVKLPAPIPKPLFNSSSIQLVDDCKGLCDSSECNRKIVKLNWTFKNKLPIARYVSLTIIPSIYDTWIDVQLDNCIQVSNYEFICVLDGNSKASINLKKCVRLLDSAQQLTYNYNIVSKDACGKNSSTGSLVVNIDAIDDSFKWYKKALSALPYILPDPYYPNNQINLCVDYQIVLDVKSCVGFNSIIRIIDVVDRAGVITSLQVPPLFDFATVNGVLNLNTVGANKGVYKINYTVCINSTDVSVCNTNDRVRYIVNNVKLIYQKRGGFIIEENKSVSVPLICPCKTNCSGCTTEIGPFNVSAGDEIRVESVGIPNPISYFEGTFCKLFLEPDLQNPIKYWLFTFSNLLPNKGLVFFINDTSIDTLIATTTGSYLFKCCAAVNPLDLVDPTGNIRVAVTNPNKNQISIDNGWDCTYRKFIVPLLYK